MNSTSNRCCLPNMVGRIVQSPRMSWIEKPQGTKPFTTSSYAELFLPLTQFSGNYSNCADGINNHPMPNHYRTLQYFHSNYFPLPVPTTVVQVHEPYQRRLTIPAGMQHHRHDIFIQNLHAWEVYADHEGMTSIPWPFSSVFFSRALL
jgi:hypothetical protein